MTVTSKMHFTNARGGRKRIQRGAEPLTTDERVPHVSRLMALAIHLDQLLRDRKVKDYAEIARLGHVSRARVTQIMNLLNLAPDIQELILFLPPIGIANGFTNGRQIRCMSSCLNWNAQRAMWKRCGRNVTCRHEAR